jgi:predicted 2-oxoglutarate/Fe(II)-dependent dioxygenase YbiX
MLGSSGVLVIALPLTGRWIRFVTRPLIRRKVWADEDFLSRSECDDLCARLRAAPATSAEVVMPCGSATDESARKADRVSADRESIELLRRRILAAKPRIERHFGFELHALQGPQFLIYRSGGFHGEHRDGENRRITLVAFLNDRSDSSDGYTGGSLVLRLSRSPLFRKLGSSLDFGAGTLVAFRSRSHHEVRPVLGGERMTVVAWFERPHRREGNRVSS